jgi:hypothetical protein
MSTKPLTILELVERLEQQANGTLQAPVPASRPSMPEVDEGPDVDPDAPPPLDNLDRMLVERVTGGLLDGAAIARPLPPLDYLVESLGFTAGSGPPHMIAGYGFSGKTVAAQSLLLSLAAGRAVWGAYTVKPRRVAHVDLEQGERLSRRRYQRLAYAMGLDLAELGDDLVLSAMPNIALVPLHAPCWEALMRGRDLIAVDSLRVAQPGCDENSSDFRQGLDMLGQLSERTGCRAVVLHHARKASDDKPGQGLQTIRGSSAILDACDAVYVFSASKGEPVSVDPVKTREHGEPPDAFALRVEDVPSEDGQDERAGLRVVLCGAEAVVEARTKASEARKAIQARQDAERVRDVLLRHPGLGTSDLRAAAGELSGPRWSAVKVVLGSELEAHDEKTGRTWRVAHYLRGPVS